jgi:hypothetical protein
MTWPIEIHPVWGCWLWRGKVGDNGRGFVWRGNTPVAAYLAVYRDEVGDVPDGLVLDHLCRNPLCVAPHHLEPVTKAENERRKAWRYRVKRTSCTAGHDLRVNRVVTMQGGILCRTCNQEARR